MAVAPTKLDFTGTLGSIAPDQDRFGNGGSDAFGGLPQKQLAWTDGEA